MYWLYCEFCGQFQSAKSVDVPTPHELKVETFFPCGRSVVEVWATDGKYRKETFGVCRGLHMMDQLPTDKLSQDDIPF